jgi:hypothetical protein
MTMTIRPVSTREFIGLSETNTIGFYTGGRTTVDGVEGNDLQKNTRLGVTVALPVNRHTSVKLYGSTGVSTRTGSDFDAVGILVRYRWGGGW